VVVRISGTSRRCFSFPERAHYLLDPEGTGDSFLGDKAAHSLHVGPSLRKSGVTTEVLHSDLVCTATSVHCAMNDCTQLRNTVRQEVDTTASYVTFIQNLLEELTRELRPLSCSCGLFSFFLPIIAKHDACMTVQKWH